MLFDEQRNGDEVDIASGAKFDVSLAEQPTTGFRWNVVSGGEPACRMAADSFASGARVLHFETVQAGVGTIQLAYRRSWETKPPAREFVLRVRVASPQS